MFRHTGCIFEVKVFRGLHKGIDDKNLMTTIHFAPDDLIDPQSLRL